MSQKVGSSHSRPPEVEIGRIGCALADPPVVEAAGLGGSDGGGQCFLDVRVPVTARGVQPRDNLAVVVAVELRAPRGHRVPVAYGPRPSVEYLDIQQSASATVTVKPPMGQVGGGVNRNANRQVLVTDVTGVGTSRLEWKISGRRRQLAGSHEFRFLVRQDDFTHGWVDATAELPRARGFRWRSSPKSVVGHGFAPLLADAAPQAARTLILFQGGSTDPAPLFVGRPLDLPLSLGPDGLSVAQVGSSGVGSVRWFDDVGGRAGYKWMHKSDDAVLLENGSVLQFRSDQYLTVSYDDQPVPGRATLRDCIDVAVVIDGVTVATHTTNSNYLTIGRIRQDISIDRPDVSRSHGALELGDNGWSYRHHSRTHDARLVRREAEATTIERDEVVCLGEGDTLQLNDRVSLVVK